MITRLGLGKGLVFGLEVRLGLGLRFQVNSMNCKSKGRSKCHVSDEGGGIDHRAAGIDDDGGGPGAFQDGVEGGEGVHGAKTLLGREAET